MITAHKIGYAYVQITSASDCRVMTYCIVYVSSCCEGHLFGDWILVKEPTATTEGLMERTCSGCGLVESETVPVTDDVPDTGDRIGSMLMVMAISAAAIVLLKKKESQA